jgi:leucyl aminopeptidase
MKARLARKRTRDSARGALAVLPLTEEDLQGAAAASIAGLSEPLVARLRQQAALEGFAAKPAQVLIVHGDGGRGADSPGCLILAGLGPRKALDGESVRLALGCAARRVPEGLRGSGRARLLLDGDRAPWRPPGRGATEGPALAAADALAAAAEGWVLGSYDHVAYKTEKPAAGIPGLDVRLPGPLPRDLERSVTRGQMIADGVVLARDLGNAPANDLFPRSLAERARAIARSSGVACRVLDEAGIRRERMGGLLGVGQGSESPPRFIQLEHRPGGRAGAAAPLVFIGKAVTFDTGGVCVKPAKNMEEMKADMSGGAAVIAAISVIARLGVRVPVVGLIPAAENMISGRAIRPGDVLRSRAGLTMEVVNTDAEGRLILADALDFARSFKPRLVVDLATLTGACVVALGSVYSGLLGNDAKALEAVKAAALASGEKAWELPLDREYFEAISSDIADLKNSGGRNAGAITAAAFLSRFAEGLPWAHLDIAGTAWSTRARGPLSKGATGVGVRTLVCLAEQAAAGA